MTVTLEAEITPGMSPNEVTRLAATVEAVGFDRLGISDVALYPDCFQLQALCAMATHRIAIGSLVTNAYTRHPVVLAGAVATVQEVSGGRAFLGLGVGAGLGPLGVPADKPVAVLRESIDIIRALCAGETVHYEGRVFSISKATLEWPPKQPIPIVIGTRSPQIMRLAGELADRALVGARYFSDDMIDTYRRWISEGATRAGRNPHNIEVAPRLTLCVSHDAEAAKRSVSLYAAHYLVLLKPLHLAIDVDRFAAIEAAVQRAGDWYFAPELRYPQELDELITDDIRDRFAIAGSPEECVPKIERLVRLGFNSFSMNLAAVRRDGTTMYDGLNETVTAFGAVMDDIKNL